MRISIATWTLVVVFFWGENAAAQSTWPAKQWPAAIPKDVGLDSTALDAFDSAILKGDKGHIDSLTLIRHGKIAFDKSYKHDYDQIYGRLAKEGYHNSVHDLSGPYNYFSTWWHPFYRRGELHTVQSITKPIVSVIIGIAVRRREFPDLDTPVIKFFDEENVACLDNRKKRMTIRHLLTMTSGVKWTKADKLEDAGTDTETLFEASNDWVKFSIDLPMKDEPGTVSRYASGNVMLLVHIFNKAVGMDIEEYAAQHLFAPLGINEYFWKRTPEGHVDGSGGLYLHPHDLAKIGYLYLHDGVWDGQQIVTADWVKTSVAGLVETPDRGKGVKMGYLWRTVSFGEKDGYRMFGAGGHGGQLLMVFPEYDVVVVATAWNALEEKPDLSPFDIIERLQGAVIEERDPEKPPVE